MPEPSSDIDEFARALSNADKLRDPFELLRIYRQCAAQQAIRKSEEEVVDESIDAEQEIQDWELEAQTWELMELLYDYRLRVKLGDHHHHRELVGKKKLPHLSNAALEFTYYEREPRARELVLIIDWIRKNLPRPIEPQLRGIKWQYTKNLIRQDDISTSVASSSGNLFGKISAPPQSSKEFVSELDPDAPYRQNLPLSRADSEYDLKVFKYIFELMQVGEFVLAQQVCKDTGNWTLKITMNGMTEYRNPKQDGFKVVDGDDEDEPYGTRNKQLWRHMCRKIANSTSPLSKIERAIYGIMSCDVDSVVVVCDSWETQLLCYLVNLVDCSLDMFILSVRDGQEQQQQQSIGDILDSLATCKSPIIESQAQDPFRVFQGSVMNNAVGDLVEDAAKKSVEMKQTNQVVFSPHFLRFLCHGVLFLDSISSGDDDDDDGYPRPQDTKIIVNTYIEYLGMEGKDGLVPLYCSQLQEDGIEPYGLFLASIFGRGDEQARNEQFKLANEYGIDMRMALGESMARLFEEEDNSNKSGGGLDLRGVDERLVYGVEWLIQAGMRGEAVEASIEIMYRVLIRENVEAAFELYGLFGHFGGGGDEEEEEEGKETLNEYARLLETIEGLNRWKDIYGRRKEYSSGLAWRNLARQEMENVVSKGSDFIFNGWFEGQQEQNSRIHQLRRKYIPYVILNYQQSLLNASQEMMGGEYIRQSLDLVVLVSGDGGGILGLMGDCLGEYMEVVGRCAIEAVRVDGLYV